MIWRTNCNQILSSSRPKDRGDPLLPQSENGRVFLIPITRTLKRDLIMADAMTSVKNKAQDAGNSFGQAAQSATENVKNAAGNVSESVKRTASNLVSEGQHSAQQAASYVSDRVGDATEAVGGRLRAAGDAIRQNAPHEGTLGQASSALAKSLEDTGDYIKREGVEGMASDMACMIKKNPIPSMLLGVGIGYLLAHATKSRN
jgi:hypothetical protein